MSPGSVSTTSLPFFDRLAARYDETWTGSPAGRLQRNAVWRELDPWVKPNDAILDLGCGTGEDALFFSRLGAKVDAVDASPAMVEAARGRGVDARLLRIENIGELGGSYALVLSNFGAMNCIADLLALREPLARLTRPGGTLALCLMNRFCLWETIYYGFHGRFKKASRRWRGEARVSPELRVFYPLRQRIAQTFAPTFRLRRDCGIGVVVPPAYVRGLPLAIFPFLDACDRRLAGTVFARTMSDHRLLIFTRNP